MTPEEKYEYWLDIAEYDLCTAEAMFDSGRWLYVVFMCQQAIEKLVKGLYTVFLDDTPPKTHNITWLVSKFDEKFPTAMAEENYELFDQLTKYYIGNRYPDFISKFTESVDKQTAENILTKTREVFTWLQTMKL
ncbi:MAG: HEPN domain-containing protein [Clostridiales bacterium]|nr:HEPN domain-containing protein [Clostridiales bacterium]